MLLYFALDSFHNTLESMCTCTFVMLIFRITAGGLCILFVLSDEGKYSENQEMLRMENSAFTA